MSGRLMALPAELRIMIYEYSFSSDDWPRTIDIFAAKAVYPPPALLSVCRHIHNEAIPVHEKAVARFWATKDFAVYLTRDYASQAFQHEAIQKCKSMTMLYTHRIDSLGFIWKGVSGKDPALCMRIFNPHPAWGLQIEYYSTGCALPEKKDRLLAEAADQLTHEDHFYDQQSGQDHQSAQVPEVANCIRRCFELLWYWRSSN